jgi:hypothetical protein
MDVVYIDKYWYEIEGWKKFQYSVPAYSVPFRALSLF